ncbi:MAG: F0F1 ATP synthase subunit A, partial [Acidimicrobiales bacterium]
FIFILFANFFEALGLGSKYEWLPAPTGDINLPLSMAFFVIVLVHISSIRSRGIKGYIKHYFQPYVFLFPVNLIEEVAKPVTLALRLFGNLLSGGLMLALIAALGIWEISHIPVGSVVVIVINPVWKLFDLFIGIIQAFIFALLTILYFDAAMSETH